MKVLLIGDIHLSDRPPSIRTETYAVDVLAKLAFAVKTANEHKVDAIVCAGDVFHIKTPSRTSHALVQATHAVFTQDSNIPVLIVPGNHDMQHDRIESLHSQPLGSLCKMQGVDMLMGWHDTLPIFGLPFLNDYQRQLPEWVRKWSARIGGDVAETELMVTHAPIFPPGQSAIYDYIDADDWASKMGTGHCYYGHIHESHGTYCSTDAAVLFCNQGAISRGSLHEATLRRVPAVTIFDPLGESGLDVFTRIEVPHRPVAEVFRLAQKAVEDDQQARLDDFLGSVQETVLDGLSIEAVREHVRALDLRPGTLEQIESCLEAVSS